MSPPLHIVWTPHVHLHNQIKFYLLSQVCLQLDRSIFIVLKNTIKLHRSRQHQRRNSHYRARCILGPFLSRLWLWQPLPPLWSHATRGPGSRGLTTRTWLVRVHGLPMLHGLNWKIRIATHSHLPRSTLAGAGVPALTCKSVKSNCSATLIAWMHFYTPIPVKPNIMDIVLPRTRAKPIIRNGTRAVHLSYLSWQAVSLRISSAD